MSRHRIDVPRTAGLVLDLDDTLYPERSFHESGFRWIALKAGLAPRSSAVTQACRALREPGGRPLDILSRATGTPASTLLEWHRTHPPDIALYQDAATFLASARCAGIPMILLTDGRSRTQRIKIDALGLSDTFREVLISEETGLDKTNIQAFVQAKRALEDRYPIAYFGDNPAKDVDHPWQIGWQVHLMLSRGDNVHPQSCDLPLRPRFHMHSTFNEIRID